MRVLITGGFGFIGGRLSEYFISAGHDVFIGSRCSHNSVYQVPHSVVFQINWNNLSALEKICNGMDVVIHAAGMNAKDCASDPLAALEFNGLATARLFKACNNVGVKRFIYLSTAHVYAFPLVGTISEKNCPRNLNSYALSHLAGENAILCSDNKSITDAVVLRLSNTFGAPLHKNVNCWDLLANDLCKQAVENRKIILRSSGFQQRDFIPISEVCKIVDKITKYNLSCMSQNIFNVGSGVSRTVLEFTNIIQQRSKIILGYEPELQLPVGIREKKQKKLKYITNKFNDNQISIDLIDNKELDELLEFCKNNF